MDDLKIQYQGFSPSEFAKAYIRELMEKVYEQAPSSATMRVSISKIGERAYKGIVRISSHAGPFFAVASGDKVIDVANRLLDRTHRQLDRWKSRRFRVHPRRLYEENVS